MSEMPPGYESHPSVGLYQVVCVPAREGLRRSIVVQYFDNPNFVGTSQIINEGTAEERLAFSGTSDVRTLQITDEAWTRERTVDGMVATFGKDRPDVRDIVEGMFPA